MEFEKQIAKEGYQSANAKFMSLADEPKEGEGKKGHWRKAKTNWIIDGKEKENKFTIWSPMNSPKTEFKSDTELKQFERYKIVWVESEEKFGEKEWVEKKIVIITEAEEDAPQSTSEETPVESSTGINISYFDEFKVAYTKAIKEVKQRIEDILVNSIPKEDKFKILEILGEINKLLEVHMLGSYLASYEDERVAELLKLCKGVTNDSN